MSIRGYSAKYNGEKLFDISGQFFSTPSVADKEYCITSGKVLMLLDGVSSASFSLPSYNINSSKIELGDDIEIYNATGCHGSRFFYGFVSSVERDEVGNTEIYVTGYNGILKCITHTYSGKTRGSLYSALYYICKYAGDKCGKTIKPVNNGSGTYEMTITYSDPNVTAFAEIENVIEQANTKFTDSTIHYWQDGYNGNDEIVVRYCTEDEMQTSPQTVEFGKNIKSLKFYNDCPDFNVINVTGCDSSGNELTFTGWNDNTNVVACEDTYLQGCIWSSSTWNFGSGFADAAALQAAAQKFINNRGKIKTKYQITAMDMSFEDGYGFDIGKKVKVVSNKHGINTTLPITELVIDMCNPLNTLIYVGGTQPRITR